MSTYYWTDEHMKETAKYLEEQLLPASLHRMNKLGYPPVTRRPDEELTCATYLTPTRICPDPAVHTSSQRPH